MFVKWMRELGLLTVALPLMVITAGCYNFSSYQTAVPLKKGEVAIGSGIGYTSFVDGRFTEPKSEGEEEGLVEIPSISLPYNDYFLRVGLGHQLDIGAKYTAPASFVLDLKFRFLKAGKFSMAIDPGVGVQSFIFLHRYDVDLPILASVDLSKHFKIYGGARVFYSRWASGFSDEIDEELKGADSMSFGGFAGISLEVSFLFIRPEVHYYRMEFPRFKGSGFNIVQPGISIGIRFGGSKSKRRSQQGLEQHEHPPPPPPVMDYPGPEPGGEPGPPPEEESPPPPEEDAPPPVDEDTPPPGEEPPPPADEHTPPPPPESDDISV